MSKHYDIIIVGSGVAGLSTLLYLTATEQYKKEPISIALIAKGAIDHTNTDWAQGGIAAVNSLQDNFDKHIEDTMIAGGLVNDINIVKKVIHAAPALMQDLIHWGIRLDKKFDGSYDLVKEGGHSEARIWHYQDITGHALQEMLVKESKMVEKLVIKTNNSILKVEKDENGIFHLLNFDKIAKTTEMLSCSQLVLATGGVGCLFEKTTNQSIATGDGIYFAHQLGAKIKNLSFIQFHPTGLYSDGSISFLISEALRGAGAILVNKNLEAFMQAYDPRGSLAPRDIVSRAILSEMEKTNSEYVYLDATQIEPLYLTTHFPNIIKHCKEKLDIDLSKDLIPVIPTQHYSCGGIVVDEFGETRVDGLYAIGECANTGLHGANRLASNSLLEAIAFAKFATAKLLAKSNKHKMPIFEKTMDLPKIKHLDRTMIQHIISKYAGVTRFNDGLKSGIDALCQLKNNESSVVMNTKTDYSLLSWENEVILELGILLLEDAFLQPKNIGVHHNSDLKYAV